MADNVAISGATVATDETTGTGEHVQLFKLAESIDGSRELVESDGDGLSVKAKGLVSDLQGSYDNGSIQPLSLTSDGRLRVATSESTTYLEQFVEFDFGKPRNLWSGSVW